MRKWSVPPLVLGLAFLLGVAADAAAQGKSVSLPKGTKIEKLGPTGYKLTTPEGSVFNIATFKKAGQARGEPETVGILGDCGIHNAKGKLVASGSNGVLKSGPSPIAGAAAKALKDVPPGDFFEIDDEVTWLPATIRFPTLRVFDRQALLKLSPQPDPPGKVG